MRQAGHADSVATHTHTEVRDLTPWPAAGPTAAASARLTDDYVIASKSTVPLG